MEYCQFSWVCIAGRGTDGACISMSNIMRNGKTFPKWLQLLTSNVLVSSFSASWSTLLYCQPLMTAILVGVSWYFIMVFHINL